MFLSSLAKLVVLHSVFTFRSFLRSVEEELGYSFTSGPRKNDTEVLKVKKKLNKKQRILVEFDCCLLRIFSRFTLFSSYARLVYWILLHNAQEEKEEEVEQGFWKLRLRTSKQYKLGNKILPQAKAIVLRNYERSLQRNGYFDEII